MSNSVLTGYLAIALFFSAIHWIGHQQSMCTHLEPIPQMPPGLLQNKEEGLAHVFLYYPLEKSAGKFAVYLNRKNIGVMRSGGRMECRLVLEGPVAVTIVEGSLYREPLTQSKNSRTISIAKGRSYYFRINGSGELEYTFSAARGEKSFAEAKDFTDQPVAFTEPADGTIPALSPVHN